MPKKRLATGVEPTALRGGCNWGAWGFFLGMAVVPGGAQADGPLQEMRVWVDLAIGTCSAATFEAPEAPEGSYVKNDSYRTTVITGRVVAAGYAAPVRIAANAEWRARNIPLPPVNTNLSFALQQWDARLCKTLTPPHVAEQGPLVRRFQFNGGCDTLPFQGACMIPLQVADLVEIRR